MDKKTKNILIISAIALLLLLLSWWYFYKKGKAKTVIAPVVKDQPGSSDPNNNPEGASTTEIKQISENLYNEMKGSNITGHDPHPYEALLALSDTDFENVYNQFNSDYQSSSGETMIQWINDQWSGWMTDFDGLKKAILAKAADLNLI